MNNGVNTVVLSGELSTYNVFVGTTSIASGSFTGGVTAAEVAETLRVALEQSSEWSGLVEGNTLTATSSFFGTTPELTITTTQGLMTNNQPATFAINRAVRTAGNAETIDFTDTEWTYYVINQEVRVDDDTVMMDDDNDIMVRRGILENVQSWDDASEQPGPNGEPANADITYLTEPFTSGARSTQAVISMNLLTVGTVQTTGTRVNLCYDFQSSTDNGATWVSQVQSFTFGLTAQRLGFTGVIPLSFSNMFTLTPSTTYHFRFVRGYQLSDGTATTVPAGANIENYLVNVLILEELVAS